MPDGNISPAFTKNNVPVVLASNDRYAPYAGVFIRSLLDHTSEEHNYDIILLQRNISVENKRLLKSLAVGYENVSVRFYEPSPLFSSFNYADETHYFPLEVFYRIVAPHILDYPGRIVTVDTDTLLKTDIARIMDVDLEGCCVGGISGAPGIYSGCMINRRCLYSTMNILSRDYWEGIYGLDYKNVESYKDYLNAGLLVFDREKYIREVDVETILDTAAQNDFLNPEECVLHTLLGGTGKIKLIDPAWNVCLPRILPTAFNPTIHDEIYGEPNVVKRIYEKPYMYHWGGKPKPWVCPDMPYGNEWWQTALRTPFVGHIIARMMTEHEVRRQYYKKRYGAENVDIWDPVPNVDRSNR